MYISPNSIVATLALLSPLSSAANIGRSQLEARDNVAVCKSVLVALKASAFCSSFVPIKDVTSTYTQTGTKSYTQTTVTGPCTYAYKKNKRDSTTPAAPSTTPSTTRAISTTPSATRPISTTPAAPSTTPKFSTTPAAPVTTPKKTTTSSKTTTKAATTPSKCSIKGVPSPVATYGCSIITEACKAFVKPKTSTVSFQTSVDCDDGSPSQSSIAQAAKIVLC